MAWVAPPVFVSGSGLTAAQLNILGADLNETSAGKATATGQYFVASALNTIAARINASALVTTAETTVSTSFADLTTPGPSVTVTCGAQALVMMNSTVQNSNLGIASSIGFAISGTTTTAASEIYISLLTAAVNQQATMGGVRMAIGMTPGAGNTFTMKYVVGAGTGTFSRRYLDVMPF